MGDDDTFEALVRATEGALRTYIAGMDVGRAAVDNIAQEAYLAVWEQAPPPGVETLRWLKGVARHKAVNHLRAASPRRRAMVDLLAVAPVAARDVVLDDDGGLLAALRRCLEHQLTPDRVLIDRHYRDVQRQLHRAWLEGGDPTNLDGDLAALLPGLYVQAQRILGNEADADDAVQKACVVLIETRARLP